MAQRVPAGLLVLISVVSLQFGSALAATLVPVMGAGGTVLLRVGLAAVLLCAWARPRLRGRTTKAWVTVLAFGLSLGFMNWAFYAALGYLPLGVVVTIEFAGPLLLALALSRRALDLVAVAAAALGVVLVSGVTRQGWDGTSGTGVVLALVAGALWAAYIVLSARVGDAFEGLDGLALAMVVATVVVLPAGASSLEPMTRQVALTGIALALLSSLIPYSLELLALRRISAAVFGVLLSVEPAVAASAGLLVLNQGLTGWQMVGIGCVVAASAVVLSRPATKEQSPAAVA